MSVSPQQPDKGVPAPVNGRHVNEVRELKNDLSFQGFAVTVSLIQLGL